MNSFSSRSHAIFTIHVLVRKENSHTISSMHLVDLAGSESVKRTGHEGAAYTEGIHINQGLLSVRRVLEALSSGNKVIPFRDSILSTVLQGEVFFDFFFFFFFINFFFFRFFKCKFIFNFVGLYQSDKR